MYERVVQRDLSALNAVDFNPVALVTFDHARGDVAFHRIHKDMQVERDAPFDRAANLAIIPNDVLKIERKPLLDFVFNQVRNLFRIDRRKRLETPKRVLTRYRNSNFFALNIVARKKQLQRLRKNFIGVGARLSHNFAVLDVVELQNLNSTRLNSFAATDRLQRRIADVDTPYGLIFCHSLLVPCFFTWRLGKGRAARAPRSNGALHFI